MSSAYLRLLIFLPTILIPACASSSPAFLIMYSCCKFLGVRAFIYEVRSWPGNNVPVNLYQVNVILYPDQKGPSPKVQLSPSKVPVLAKMRQISAGSSFRARFPHPALWHPLTLPKAQLLEILNHSPNMRWWLRW